jgi:hypothetical protein
MWIKKINDFFDNMSEYDNNSLSLHVAVDLIDMLKERVKFELDKECNMSITLLQYNEIEEEEEVDEEGLLHWCHFTFHKELIDIILSLKSKFTLIQNSISKLVNDSKTIKDDPNNEIKTKLDTTSKELETLKKIITRVDTYRRNTFAYLRDKDGIDTMLDNIRICKERND